MDKDIFGEKTIIFEDDNLVVIYKSGKSDFLFVTFGDLVALANGLKIYADPVSTKLEYSCLGFMPKSGNWYPSTSMNQAIQDSKDIIDRFSSVFLYGGSMGGYAAIKYSKKLGASHTIACCPQWSISPSECEGHSSGYEKYYKPYMSDMGIYPNDISGTIYVIYDPMHKIDSFHFSKISRQSKNVIGISAHYTGHSVTAAVSGTNNMAMMIESAIKNDHIQLQRIVSQIRRKTSYRTGDVLKASSIKHPYLTAKVIIKNRYNSVSASEALDASISTLIKMKEIERLNEILMLIESINHNINIDLARTTINNILVHMQNHGNIMSFHGNKIMYNFLTLTLSQEEHDNSKYTSSLLTAVSIIDVGCKLVLGVIKYGKIYFIKVSGNLFELHNAYHENNHDSMLTVNLNSDGTLFISNNGRFLTAEPTRAVRLIAPHVKAWEIFKCC